MYDVYITSSAKKYVKRLPSDVRLQVVIICERYIAKEPFNAEKLKNPLDKCRSFYFKMNNTQYRIVYVIVEDEKRIDVILVGTRENFYQRLRVVLRK